MTTRGGRRKLLLGIGVASYVEITAGGGSDEFGAVEVHDDGTATIYAGTQSHGQGHQTAYAMLVADQTGIPVEHITLVDGDTDRVRTGGGTGGSRSLQLGGSAVRGATEAMVTKAKHSPLVCWRPPKPTSWSTPRRARSAWPVFRRRR